MTTALAELRAALADVDRAIISLVAKRQRLASEIGGVKREAGMPTRNYGQESIVLARARAAAEALDVPLDVAEELMLLLIRSSLTVQERDSVAASRTGAGKRALVIGGLGRMGRWMTRFLESQGYVVEAADPGGSVDRDDHLTSHAESPLDHDVIVVAAPLRITNEILHDLARRKPVGLVFDIGSLKSPVRDGLRACVEAGLAVASIHPMFGPDTDLLTGRHVIVVDVGVPDACRRARELFASTMAIPVEMDLDRHDRAIAYILGLSHALNIAFFTALAESGETATQLAHLSSTTFDAQLAVAGAVAGEHPALYYEIQRLNDFNDESLGALAAAVERLRAIVAHGDEAAFATLMEDGREYLRQRGETGWRGGGTGQPDG